MERALAAIDVRDPGDRTGTAIWSNRRRRITATLAVVAAVILLVLVGRPIRRSTSVESRPGPGPRVVAVLPLENLSGDPAKQYLGAGVAETLTMALSKVNSATVISRSEVQEAIRSTREPRKVAQDLHASLLVDGSVQQAGDDILISLRIFDPDGKQRWSNSYPGKSSEIFALQREMAAA